MLYCYPYDMDGDQSHYVGYLEENEEKIKWTWEGIEKYNLCKTKFSPYFFFNDYILSSPMINDFPNPSNFDWRYSKSIIQQKYNKYVMIIQCSTRGRFGAKLLATPKYRYTLQNKNKDLLIYAETGFEAAVENYFASYICENMPYSEIDRLSSTNIKEETANLMLENILERIKEKKNNKIIKPGPGKEEISLGATSKTKITFFCDSLQKNLSNGGCLLLGEYLQGVCCDIINGFISEA